MTRNRVITRQTLANEVPSRWAEQYLNEPDHSNKKHIQKKLESLPLPISPDEVDSIIGNGSWTRIPECDQCLRTGLDFVVTVGGGKEDIEFGYRRESCNLCCNCLKAMADMAFLVQAKPE